MHNNFIFLKKTITIWKKKRFHKWVLHYFLIFFCLAIFHESQTWGVMAVKINIYYILCTLILSNSLHLIVGSKLFFTKMNLKFQNVVMQILKFLLVFIIAKGCHQDFNLLCTTILVIYHVFEWKVVFTLIMIPMIFLAKCDKQF